MEDWGLGIGDWGRKINPRLETGDWGLGAGEEKLIQFKIFRF